ncbi:unnamed protein product [Sphagnum jensenii]|uniref:Uncharacterized protein n=1 Tax=Sphagnum jensenii TaxID=128206 RepID=A0ABP0V6E3_9BRYO
MYGGIRQLQRNHFYRPRYGGRIPLIDGVVRGCFSKAVVAVFAVDRCFFDFLTVLLDVVAVVTTVLSSSSPSIE